MARRPDRAGRARSLSRKLAMQALYQWQLTGQSAAELRNQYAGEDGFADADAGYFRELVDGVTKLSQSSDKEYNKAASFRKILQATLQDPRVIIIKLADRYHNMTTLDALRPD